LILGAVIAIICGVTKVIPAPRSKQKILTKAKEKAATLKQKRDEEVQRIKQDTQAKLAEISDAKDTANEMERLKKLADLANRKKS